MDGAVLESGLEALQERRDIVRRELRAAVLKEIDPGLSCPARPEYRLYLTIYVCYNGLDEIPSPFNERSRPRPHGREPGRVACRAGAPYLPF
jgi:hypothetical protein